MMIMPRKQQYKIANILRKYVLKDHKDHVKYGLCHFYNDREEFEFGGMTLSYDFFKMFPIPYIYIGGRDGGPGATPLRLEFATRLSDLLYHPGIYIESGKNGISCELPKMSLALRMLVITSSGGCVGSQHESFLIQNPTALFESQNPITKLIWIFRCH